VMCLLSKVRLRRSLDVPVRFGAFLDAEALHQRRNEVPVFLVAGDGVSRGYRRSQDDRTY
jgi:hypothetical protein